MKIEIKGPKKEFVTAVNSMIVIDGVVGSEFQSIFYLPSKSIVFRRIISNFEGGYFQKYANAKGVQYTVSTSMDSILFVEEIIVDLSIADNTVTFINDPVLDSQPKPKSAIMVPKNKWIQKVSELLFAVAAAIINLGEKIRSLGVKIVKNNFTLK